MSKVELYLRLREWIKSWRYDDYSTVGSKDYNKVIDQANAVWDSLDANEQAEVISLI